MINKCRYHGEKLEFSKLHGYYICPISICKYHVLEDGTQYYGNTRIREGMVNWAPTYNYTEDNVPNGLIIQGEIIYEEKLSEEDAEYSRGLNIQSESRIAMNVNRTNEENKY